MNFRMAIKNDVFSIIQLLADDKLGSKREDLSNPINDIYLNAFYKIDKDPNQDLVVLEDAGKIVGTFQLSFLQYLTYKGGIRAQIEAVRIHSDYRGQGLGEKMIAWAIERAKEKGAHLLQLTTDKQRADALRFYEKLGFKASHEGMKLHF